MKLQCGCKKGIVLGLTLKLFLLLGLIKLFDIFHGDVTLERMG
jgi:hypothetical protein